MESGAFHNRLWLLRLPSWRVWNWGETRDLAGRLAERVRYPKCSSKGLMVLHGPGNVRIGHAGPACDEIKSTRFT
jgi:hypothetical protein